MSEGTTPSERYLRQLARRSFLSLWSHANPFTDEGVQRTGHGRELCDLLVVFGNDVIVFSDKYINFSRSHDTGVAWSRWYRKAISASAKQIHGAESWLRRFPNRVYLDSSCREHLPVEIPSSESIRVHRVCVALGVFEACRDYFGGNSIGSLIVDSGQSGDSEHQLPFHVGDINPDKGFVHVFEDFTLNAVFSELDTITDFIEYLAKRERLLRNRATTIVAPGEEQLLAVYLTRLNSAGEHDFVFTPESEPLPDLIHLDESFWDGMVDNPQYAQKKAADAPSYAWDRLIEHFIKYANVPRQSQSDIEVALRYMASEPRIRRRQLAAALIEILQNTPPDKPAARVGYSNDYPDHVYVFIVLPQLESESYEAYRNHRRTMLEAYANVAKLRFDDARYVIGFATEPRGDNGSSEDLLVLDVSNWTKERANAAREIQRGAGILIDGNLRIREDRTDEYPASHSQRQDRQKPNIRAERIRQKSNTKPADKQKRRRKMQKASRRKSRGKK